MKKLLIISIFILALSIIGYIWYSKATYMPTGTFIIKIIDKNTNKPIADKEVIIRKRQICQPDIKCPRLPYISYGTSKKNGRVFVGKIIFDDDFYIDVDGYNTNGPFKKQKNSNLFIRNYSDGTIYEFDYKKDDIIIKIDSKKE